VSAADSKVYKIRIRYLNRRSTECNDIQAKSLRHCGNYLFMRYHIFYNFKKSGFRLQIEFMDF